MRQSPYSKLVVALTLLFAIALYSCSEANNSTAGDCVGDECKQALIIALGDLNKIRFGPDSREARTHDIRQIVDRFRDSRHVAAFALLTRAIKASCGGDAICSKESAVEPAYDNAFWYCVETLARDRESNRELLGRLKEAALLNDTERGDWGRVTVGETFP
jgi:hypothetical protein